MMDRCNVLEQPEQHARVQAGTRVGFHVWACIISFYVAAHGVLLTCAVLILTVIERQRLYFLMLPFTFSCVYFPVKMCRGWVSNPALTHWHPPFTECCRHRIPYRWQRPLRWLWKMELVLLTGLFMCFALTLSLAIQLHSVADLHVTALEFAGIPVSLSLIVWIFSTLIFQRSRWRRAYLEWCDVLNDAGIRWVKVGALRRWLDMGQCIPRMQDLVPSDYVDQAAGSWREDGHKLVVSHAWLAEGNPDPNREQLAALVSELNRLGVPDSDLVFYDHASIPQNPRTPDETRRFKVALRGMNLLYTFQLAKVLIIPEVSEHAPNPMPYAARGWCFFELAISSAFDTIVNFDSLAVLDVLRREELPASTSAFAASFREKVFTVSGDRDTVQGLYQSLYKKVLEQTNYGVWRFRMSVVVLQVLSCLLFDLMWMVKHRHGRPMYPAPR